MSAERGNTQGNSEKTTMIYDVVRSVDIVTLGNTNLNIVLSAVDHNTVHDVDGLRVSAANDDDAVAT